jgi:hypothetical protein
MKPSLLMKCLTKAIEKRQALLLTGPPGVGKTDVVKQASKITGAELIVSHPVVDDPTNYKGMPWVIQKADGRTEAVFLPFSNLSRIIEAKNLTVFLLDDLGQAPPAVQAAAMQLLLARSLNEFKISDQVVFMACSNRREDKAGVQGILEPVKSRFFAILPFDVDLVDWTIWAAENKMPFDLINFIRWRPELLHQFEASRDMKNTPCPRTIAHAGEIILSGYPDECRLEMLAGAAGAGFATEFVGFLKLKESIPNVDDLIMNPDKADIPNEMSILYALCGALAERADVHTFKSIISYAERLTKEYKDAKGQKREAKAEFNIIIIKDCLLKDPALKKNKSFLEWQIKHKDTIL